MSTQTSPETGPWTPPPIADYGFLSDCTSAALVDRRGSIDWWCVPRFDSASVFGRLLDPGAGHWSLEPVLGFETSREYVSDTLVLRTTFRTSGGSVAVIDALAFKAGARGHEIGRDTPHLLVRRIEGLCGEVEMTSELAPRMEYGRTTPHLAVTGAGLTARGGPVELSCSGPLEWDCRNGTARASFTIRAAETIELCLQYQPAFPPTPPQPGGQDVRAGVDDTVAAWRSWAEEHAGYDGAHPAEVARSSIVLQGLTYQRSGAVVAATTSLPEEPGGKLNFDYRFAWLRDLSLTIRSLWIAACPAEPNRLLSWFANAAGQSDSELVQIMYGVEGERDLTERELPHLMGYRGSRPVRVGNQAWEQKQLDVLGEVLDAAHLLRDSLDFDVPAQLLLVQFANRAAASWAEPDAGMWEARDGRRHYTTSKVMCWVALDRAVRLADRLGDRAEPSRWVAARNEIRGAVLDQAWSDPLGAYAGAFGSDELDASVLLLPLVGFLTADDPRMWATIKAIEKQLDAGGLIRRWVNDPYGFVLCTYWLVECLAMGGEVERAELLFRRTTGYANDLGLLAEQADPETGDQLGNMPQAFSHVALINAAWRLAHPAAEPIPTPTAPASDSPTEGSS